MKKIYQENGLPFWTEDDLLDRKYVIEFLESIVRDGLQASNPAWHMKQIEAPMLISRSLLNPEYTEEDMFVVDKDTALRPETTPATYAYVSNSIEHQETKPPICTWQVNKSWRRETDQITANYRLKEFWQQEFQAIYTANSKNDYYGDMIAVLADLVTKLFKQPVRIVPSDRLPKYSLVTTDIEVQTPHKWLEIASISHRIDVPFKWNGLELMNVEMAFGVDRIVAVRSFR